MPLLINRQLVDQDPWLRVEDEQALPADGALLLPLARYLDQKDQLAGRQLGVLINGDDDINSVIAEIDKLQLVAIEIPAFTDGRGFSFARLLRRAGFNGQVRAIGDVSRDRLEFMERCGFDAYDIPDDRFKPEIIEAFDEISVDYQGAADDPRPLFRR
ncbi:DUF934 domain-containing protein [Marinobacterium arenosum]|uniref:DUF934 domain-containing protein n=1 Tax=Marinobacterium arenosum TaxID=2862496 RepID=UPI001C966249|nr:DUF934 domain-containing protein [Marinobacterium arenosum]MBY4675460.1 DUF934 domain-containing protein [Marinobacterium arenosum]